VENSVIITIGVDKNIIDLGVPDAVVSGRRGRFPRVDAGCDPLWTRVPAISVGFFHG
jgi:hypothetical protein